ncbi:MAG: CPBP family intramembrane glutamic endopeptidase [Actinomycetes bacterium]
MAIAIGISIALVGAGVVSVAAAVLGALSGREFSVGSPGVKLAATVVQDAAMVASVFITAKLAEGKLRLQGFGFVPSLVSRRRATLLGVATWLAFIGFTAGWTALVGKSGKQSILDDLGIDQSVWLWIGTVVLITVIAPLAEEILFRGFLFSTLWRWMPLGLAALITGALFGALHLGGSPPLLTVPLGVLGVFLCLLRAATGSLIPCIVVHAVNNTLAFGVGEKLAGVWVLALLVFSVGSVVVISLRLTRHAYTESDEGSQPPELDSLGDSGPPSPPPAAVG